MDESCQRFADIARVPARCDAKDRVHIRDVKGRAENGIDAASGDRESERMIAIDDIDRAEARNGTLDIIGQIDAPARQDAVCLQKITGIALGVNRSAGTEKALQCQSEVGEARRGLIHIDPEAAGIALECRNYHDPRPPIEIDDLGIDRRCHHAVGQLQGVEKLRIIRILPRAAHHVAVEDGAFEYHDGVLARNRDAIRLFVGRRRERAEHGHIEWAGWIQAVRPEKIADAAAARAPEDRDFAELRSERRIVYASLPPAAIRFGQREIICLPRGVLRYAGRDAGERS